MTVLPSFGWDVMPSIWVSSSALKRRSASPSLAAPRRLASASIPSVTTHPHGQAWAGQSLDNKIVVYGAGEKVREMRKKVFKGHLNAGYTCQIGFSPNGRYITSGDGEGRLFFWDWKSTKILRKFKAHDNGPCIGNLWHPIEPSWCITCGWDSQIKLWD